MKYIARFILAVLAGLVIFLMINIFFKWLGNPFVIAFGMMILGVLGAAIIFFCGMYISNGISWLIEKAKD